MLATNS